MPSIVGPSQSIIADLFSKNERPRALGVYAIGTYAGTFTTVGALLFIWAARSIRADIQRAS